MDLFEAHRDDARDPPLHATSPSPTTRSSRCIRAAVQGPSGGNIQPWQFLAVTDPDGEARARRRLPPRLRPLRAGAARRSPAVFRSPEDEASFRRTLAASRHLADHLGEAPALVLVLHAEHLDDARGRRGPARRRHALRVRLSRGAELHARRARASASARRSPRSTASTRTRCAPLCAIPKRYEVVALIPMGRPRKPFGPGRRRPTSR